MASVLVAREGEVAVVTLNRPEALNALSVEMVRRLREVFLDLREDDAVRAVVVTGAGRGFCAGADVPEMLNREGDRGRAIRKWLNDDLNTMLRAMLDLPKPVITAVNGVAAGGGVGIALAGDMVFAAESADFIQVFGPQLSVIPDLGCSWFMANLLPRGRALPLMLTGDRLSAKQAADWGLIWQCTGEDEVVDQAMAAARKLADGPVEVFAEIRHATDRARQVELSDQLDFERDTNGRLCGTASFEEATRAFTEKRKPNFRS